MKIDFFVINLDRSPERLSTIRADAAALGIDLIRSPAVDGKTVPPEARHDLDLAGFLRDHGKQPMDGEYGCYVSHLAALRAIAASAADAGVIFEDDIAPQPELLAVLEALGQRDDWDVVRFAHHRQPTKRRLRTLPHGRALYAALFGPTGSAAAYVVRREAAARLANALTPMRLPYDVALERGWATGLRTRDIWPDLVRFGAHSKSSLTQAGRRYGAMKLKPWRRLPTLGFRTLDLVRRAWFAGAAKGNDT
ncbi:glycosyltransferase family 25 protein [Aureimonas pseudogalii]|uniref:Glycosyl transferase family 25 n=1 Tax=Aureimonas pseudogalii TaxID=1744844 RepID=A0A7W6H595_9HYPH|nr:glycosyltransferase family 25 protein [Aureimonas pseudogalii]MBB3998809.1 glycosyl transferase family 25 [Aureimonas pseudogalii]